MITWKTLTLFFCEIIVKDDIQCKEQHDNNLDLSTFKEQR